MPVYRVQSPASRRGIASVVVVTLYPGEAPLRYLPILLTAPTSNCQVTSTQASLPETYPYDLR